MKRYHVVVDGTAYTVDIEEAAGDTTQQQNTKVDPKPVQRPADDVKSQPEESETSETVKGTPGNISVAAPMPGTILDVKVDLGQTVSAGTTLFIMEAMKMENEIVAPQDGKIASISTVKGASVNAGDILVTMD